MPKSVLVRFAIVLAALAQSALWNPPGGSAAQVIPAPRASVVARGSDQAVDPLPPIAPPAREEDISPTPVAPSARNGETLAPGEYRQVADSGWPDQMSRVSVVVTSGASVARIQAAQELDLADPGVARQVSPFGVAFLLGADGALARRSGIVMSELALDYAQLAFPAGGDMEGRMQFMVGANCRTISETIGSYDCAVWTPLPTVVDRTAKILTVNLDGARTVAELGLQSGASITGASDAGASGGDAGGMILALMTGGSSEEGDYRANTLDAVGDYQVGVFAGTAELGYPFPVPPPAAGAAPEVRLSYSSGSVDGFGGNKNGQPGWMGLGWNLSMGSVTRITRQCYITDTVTNPNRCIVPDKFTLTLNGHSSELVRDTAGGTGRYRLQDDPTWRVELKTDGAAGHPDQQAEYFLVTTPDGTQYRFGGEIEPETGADLDSAF